MYFLGFVKIKKWLVAIVVFFSLTCSIAWAAPTASFTVNTSSGCSPLNVQFNNTSTGAVSYYWEFGDGNTSTLQAPSNLYTIAGNYTVTLIATDAAGNKDSSVSVNLITVIGDPQADFNSSSTASCLYNNSFSFVSNSTGAASWLWDFGDGTFSSLQNPTHSYATSGTFTIKLIVNNSSGCSDIKIINHYITVYAQPTASFTENSVVACDTSQAINFTSTSTGVVTYQWSFGDGTSSTLQNPAHSFATSGTFPITLVVTSVEGCIDTTPAPVNINVNNNSWASFSSNIDSGCAPMNVNFSCNVPKVSSILWNFGNGVTSTLANAPAQYLFAGSYTVSMTVTTANGCNETVTIPNYINAGLRPTVNFTMSDSVGCSPFDVQFTSHCQNAVSYLWGYSEGTNDSTVNANHTFNNQGAYTVALYCTGSTGCIASLVKHNVIQVSKDIANFYASPRVSCPPMVVNFTSLSQGNKLSYLWKFGDGTTSTQENPTHTYTNSGIYDITLAIRDSTGCMDTLFQPGYIQVIDPSGSYITPDTTMSCAPLTTQFNDNTVGAVSWFWNFGDGTTSNIQDPVHTYSSPGIYTVSLTSQLSGGCTQIINDFDVFDLQGGIAKFGVQQSQCPPYTATFKDSSTNAVSWFWNFGDGTTSTLQNPSHNYSKAGWYSVSLTITSANGCTSSTMYSNCVYYAPFQANFYGVPVNTGFPQTIDFYANSVGATGWFWSFGDGGTSTSENPSHTYTHPGNYQIMLTITEGPCTLTYSPPPFTAGEGDSLIFNPVTYVPPQPQSGCAPFFVTFTNNNPACVSSVWNFGDGTSDSAADTFHTYYKGGIYNVILTTIDTSGVTKITVYDSLVRVSGPIARFDYSQGSSCQNTDIAFHDSSVDADHWLWNFGDGTSDTTENPTHLFIGHNSNYNVSLKITDNVGCSSSLSTSIFSSFVNPIIVAQSDVCNADTVQFNTSLQNYTSYLWSFGDSTSSIAVAPRHVYASEGVYNVTLVVTDNSGCSQTFTLNPAITVNAPVAKFSINGKQNSCSSFDAYFANLSTGADYYTWDFGDSITSNEINPTHFYQNPGSYAVTLTAFSGGCSSTSVQPNYVNVYQAHAAVGVSMDGPCLPMIVQFTDLSTAAVSWQWRFGDDSTSTLQNPEHTYYTTPQHPYNLTIIDSHGCTDSVSGGPLSTLYDSFIASGDSGCIPFTVNFTNQCVLASSYYWEFGDGTFSTDANPQHIYSDTGSYDVTLIIKSYPGCSDSLTLPNFITAISPHADFMSPDLSACAPSVVNFTNLSEDATSWVWDFGDGTSSTNQNPNHIYNVPGTYDVKLLSKTVWGCADSIIKTKYITVLGPLTSFNVSDTAGCNPFTVQFTDHSKNAVAWAWSFGDGYSSTDENPAHIFKDTGSYTVALVTHDSTGCSSYYSYPQKIIVHGLPVASFSTNDTSGCQPYVVTLNNTSTGQDSALWNFGDGTSLDQTNAVHTYSNPGSYTVTLISFNQFGCTDTFQLNKPIVVNMTPVVHFSAATTAGCTPLIVSFYDSSNNLLNPVYSWNFGNGETSTNATPSETFINPGFYNVSLAITNSNGCSDSLSVPSFINVFDTTPPPISPIYSVSVTSNSTVQIIWQNNSDINLGSYELFRYNPVSAQWDNIYTNPDPDNTSFSLTSSYTDSALNNLKNTYSYKLLTTNICGNAIGLDQLIANTTIKISTQTVGQSINVYWTPYEGCTVSNYTLYRAAPGSTPQLIATLAPDSLSYLDTTLSCPYSYSYRVTANDLDGRPYISNSDTAIGTPINIYANQLVDVVRTTVVNNQYILTEWKQPVVHPESVIQFDIYRSVDDANFYYLSSVPSVQTDFSDYSADVQRDNYYYKVLVVNQCNIDETLSDLSSSILLSGTVSDDYVFSLHWTDYKHWADGVDHYVIEKQDANGLWVPVGRVDGNTTQFEDH